MVRTSVSQRQSDGDTGILRNCSPALRKYSSPHISEAKLWGGEEAMVSQHDTLDGPTGFDTNKMDLTWVPEFPIRSGILSNYFVTGEDVKAIFSIPSNTVTPGTF